MARRRSAAPRPAQQKIGQEQIEKQLAGLQVKLAQGQPDRHSSLASAQKVLEQALAGAIPVIATKLSARAPTRVMSLSLIGTSFSIRRPPFRLAAPTGTGEGDGRHRASLIKPEAGRRSGIPASRKAQILSVNAVSTRK